ncbi:hypothetical protein QFZ33_001023 [Arthrobacter globiformis]|nr:hypothetical protein [Arthrobacter globiformis]
MGGPGMQAPGSGTMPGQGGDFAPNGLGGMGSGVSAAVHSEYMVEENGAYVTKVAQLGTVSTVSSGSVTVKCRRFHAHLSAQRRPSGEQHAAAASAVGNRRPDSG